jgi:hypothetical protein
MAETARVTIPAGALEEITAGCRALLIGRLRCVFVVQKGAFNTFVTFPLGKKVASGLATLFGTGFVLGGRSRRLRSEGDLYLSGKSVGV